MRQAPELSENLQTELESAEQEVEAESAESDEIAESAEHEKVEEAETEKNEVEAENVLDNLADTDADSQWKKSDDNQE